MPLIQAIILALVQALTEFLPVSSTAHLVLFPWLLHWPDPGEAFDVALHAGTLVAVLLYFFKDWLTLALCGLGMNYPKTAQPAEVQQHRRLFWYMVVGTIPGAILGKLFDKQIEEHLALARNYRRVHGCHRTGHVVGRLQGPAEAHPRAIHRERCHRHRQRASPGALARRFPLRHHHIRRLVSQLHARSGHPIFVSAFGPADCGRSRLQVARF